HEPERGADARGDRLPSILPVDRCSARRLDRLDRRTQPVDAVARQDSDRRDAADRSLRAEPGTDRPSRPEPRRCLWRSRARRVRPRGHVGEGAVAADRCALRAELSRRRRVRAAAHRRPRHGSSAGFHLLRADGGDHERAQHGAARPVQGAAEHRAGRRVEGKLLDSAERVLTTPVLDTFRLDGKVALVTGGARGLGQTMARALAEAGADVALTGRAIGPSAEAASAIATATGRRAKAFVVDVTVAGEIDRLVSEVEAELGPIDILVNNAGV